MLATVALVLVLPYEKNLTGVANRFYLVCVKVIIRVSINEIDYGGDPVG